MNVVGFSIYPNPTTPNVIKESTMITPQSATPCPTPLTDQPTQWPKLYFLPETHYVQRQRAANSPEYNPGPQPVIIDYRTTRTKPPHETRLQRFLRQEVEILQDVCADAWRAIKQAGRDMVRWLVRWIVTPVSIACAIWVPIGNPMDLPL
jgi:hypothetical protein